MYQYNCYPVLPLPSTFVALTYHYLLLCSTSLDVLIIQSNQPLPEIYHCIQFCNMSFPPQYEKIKLFQSKLLIFALLQFLFQSMSAHRRCCRCCYSCCCQCCWYLFTFLLLSQVNQESISENQCYSY